jgi:hypothetical protein
MDSNLVYDYNSKKLSKRFNDKKFIMIFHCTKKIVVLNLKAYSMEELKQLPLLVSY